MELNLTGGILGFVLLLLALYAIVKIIGSGASTAAKVVWVLVVLFLPLIGLIAWFFFGPKG